MILLNHFFLMILPEIKNIIPFFSFFFNSGFFPGLQLKTFANLCEQELNQLVEQRHEASNA